ncbi:PucR family transcriptional regulator [Isoptericola jiangsuensis]|nr:PucR family transcriptional regulator [Isoptericola jiangsuensis]
MVTVRDVIGSTELALRGVHVPRPDEPVRWVATSELADPSPFLEGGELLLTTGLGTDGWGPDDVRWETYVARLAAAGVAAVGLGTGLTHAEVPAALARACRARSLNLVEVPRRTPFVAISRLTASMLQEGERAEARRAAKAQRELTEAAARRPGPEAVLRTLVRHLGGGVAVVGPRDDAPTAVGSPPPAGLDLVAEAARLRERGARGSATLAVGDATCVLLPVGLGTRPDGHLAAWTPEPLDGARRGALTTAVALLGLDAQRRRDRREQTARIRGRALELLVAGDARTAAVLAGAADDAPAEAAVPRRLRVVAAAAPAGTAPAAATPLLEDAAGALEGEEALVSRTSDGLRLAAADPVAQRCAAALAARGLTAGVGELVDAARAPRSARTAAHALAQTTSAVPVVRWDDLVGDGVLALVGDEPAAAFAATWLAPLRGREPLLEVLRAFLRHHGSRGKVAEELGVHRNTVRQRVAEIEAALGRPLDDPATRVNAWVALQAHDARALGR